MTLRFIHLPLCYCNLSSVNAMNWFSTTIFTTVSLQPRTFDNNGCPSAGALYQSNGYWQVMRMSASSCFYWYSLASNSFGSYLRVIPRPLDFSQKKKECNRFFRPSGIFFQSQGTFRRNRKNTGRTADGAGVPSGGTALDQAEGRPSKPCSCSWQKRAAAEGVRPASDTQEI